MVRVDKARLRAALVIELEAALASARAAHGAAVEGATHAEARAENPKDTRGLEQSYLARGHAERVGELEVGLAAVSAMPVRAFGPAEAISLGALATVDDRGRRFFLAAAGGGIVLPGDITVLTPTSPIGRALLGKCVDDECEVAAGGTTRTLTVTAVD